MNGQTVKTKRTGGIPAAAVYLGAFAVLFALCMLFPYTEDDWAWGASVGTERLASFFDNYNGRYLGNLSIILLARSRILRAAVMSAVYIAISVLISRTADKGNRGLFFITSALLLFVPRLIFRQVVAWSSGFSNYALPLPLFLICTALLIRAFDDKPRFGKAAPIAAFLCAAAGSLFMENLTLAFLALPVLVMGYTLIIKKKVFLTHVTMLAGAAAGAAIMFSNSAYHTISQGGDSYRTMPTGLGSLIAQAVENLCGKMSREACGYNTLLNVFLCAVLLLIMYRLAQKGALTGLRGCTLRISTAIVLVYTFYFIVRRIYTAWTVFMNLTAMFEAGFTVLFLLALFAIACFISDDKRRRMRLVFELAVFAVLTAPLLAVTPVESRCFFAGYVMLVIFAVELFVYSMSLGTQPVSWQGLPQRAAMFLCACVLVFYFSIFTVVCYEDNRRINNVREQVAQGKTSVELEHLPYEGYMWLPTPREDSMWETRFKDFYGISQQADFVVVEYSNSILDSTAAKLKNILD